MTALGITLLVLGVIIFAVSFFIPDKEERAEKKDKELQKEQMKEEIQQEIHRAMDKELDGMKLRVNEATNETVEYGMEKCERSLEKISNDKIMAVSEYATTIMEEIDNNHKEIMFLYDMLNNKQVDLKNTVRKAEATAKEVDSRVSQNMDYVNQLFGTVENTPEYTPVVDNATEVHNQQVRMQQVAYHGEIDESIFENMTRNDIPPQPQRVEVTSLFNSAIAEENNNISAVNEVPVEAIPQPVNVMDEPVPQENNIYSEPVNYSQPVFNNDGINNSNQQILMLYDQGMDIVNIAKELNLGVGEVQLVIDLFKS